METLLSIIFFTVLFVYLASLLGRWLLRRWILRKQREFSDAMGGSGTFYTNFGPGSTRSGQNSRREGEVKVNTTRGKEKKVSGSVGEYVDYEEIEIEE